jgi:hypothetical protein
MASLAGLGDPPMSDAEDIFKALIAGADIELAPNGNLVYYVLPFAHMDLIADRYGVTLND